MRFHALADTTLRRSNRAYFADEIGRSFSWILMGAIPIVGLLYFKWSAREWLIYLLVGAWTGVLLDIFKLYFLYGQIMKSANAAYEDNFVWTIVDAMRQGEDMAPHDHLRARYQPKMGILVDIVFGAVGTVMTIGLFPEDVFAAFEISTLFWSVIGMVAYRVAFTAWEIIEQRASETEDRTVRVAVGLRGVGLFLLGFLVAMIVGDETHPRSSGDQTAWWAMLIVNALAIVVSLLNIWGMYMIRGNARWLRTYLADKSGQK